jgi:cytoskeletal protein CcmA (bactofilin family)
MFGSKSESSRKTDSLLAHEVSIEGNVTVSGALYLDGNVKGNIIAPQESGAMLTISTKGKVEGCVQVPSVEISGTVLGDVYSSDRLVLKASARVVGDVYYHILEMEAGAEITGHMVFCEQNGDLSTPIAIDSDHKVSENREASKATEHYIRSLTVGQARS